MKRKGIDQGIRILCFDVVNLSLLRRHEARALGQKVLPLGALRERNHVFDGFSTYENCDEPVESYCEACVGRTSCSERFEEMREVADACFRHLEMLVNPRDNRNVIPTFRMSRMMSRCI